MEVKLLRLSDVRIDGMVSACVSLATGLCFGVIPAWTESLAILRIRARGLRRQRRAQRASVARNFGDRGNRGQPDPLGRLGATRSQIRADNARSYGLIPITSWPCGWGCPRLSTRRTKRRFSFASCAAVDDRRGATPF
jgi:hypothetical protein